MIASPPPEPSAYVERFNWSDAPLSAVIAIPVKDEAERISDCLFALAAQDGVDLAEVAVVLLLNNCQDETADRVRSIAAELPFRVEMRSVELAPPHANAGWARRLAMDAALALVGEHGLLLTTDADSFVESDWLAVNLAEIAAGSDAVAGFITAEPTELMALEPAILERGALEWEYQHLAAELEARADPEPHDAWPRHNQNCGASAAVTVAAYRRIGGLPTLPVGEDRAMFAELRRADLKIRHSLDVLVMTSARTNGRASGGLADAIRLRTDPDHPCDDQLEVAVMTLRRAYWRGLMRETWRRGRVSAEADAWAARLRLTPAEVRRAARRATFGQLWADLEAASPRLQRQFVTGAGLKREVRRIKRLVYVARLRGKAAQADEAAKLRVAAA